MKTKPYLMNMNSTGTVTISAESGPIISKEALPFS